MEIVKNIAHKLLVYLFRTFFEATKIYDGWQPLVVGVAHHLFNASII